MLGQISDMEIAATAQTAKEMFALLKRGAAHVLLMDVSLAKENGVTALIPEIKRRYPRLKIITLSAFKQRELAETVIETGGNGYLLKSTTKEELVTSIQQVMQGETYLGKGVRIPVQSGEIDYELSLIYRNELLKKYNLTRREVDIISLIAQAYSNKEIANLLHISENTVKAHRRNLKTKLHFSDTANIVRFAFQTGITLP